MRHTTIHHNPINLKEIYLGLLTGFLTFIGLIVVFSIKGKFDSLIWAVIIGCSLIALWFMGLWNEFWMRPRMVEIGDEGLRLCFWPWRMNRFLKWSEISNINLSLENPEINGYKAGRDGFLRSHRKVYCLFWPIANEAREAFKEKIGEYPPLNWH